MPRIRRQARPWFAAAAVCALMLSLLTVPATQAAETPAQYATDFSDDEVGAPPAGWTVRWNPAEVTVLYEPRRLRYRPGTGSRSLATFDAVGTVVGDVEVAGVVRVPGPMPNTRFQLHLHGGGDASTTESYYVDVQTGTLRINRYAPGGVFNNIAQSSYPDFREDTWFQVVLRREGDSLRTKIWPFGQDEPDEWMLETTHTLHDSGWVGVGHFGASTVNEWAWFSVGTDGEPAPRPPADLVPLPEPPETVAGVHVEQEYGFATVSWDAADDATSYEIERTPLDGDEPVGPAEVVGRWLPERYDGDELTFADSGFVLGERYRWRVRALAGGLAGKWSEPVAGRTRAVAGPDEYVTGFELSGGSEWTTHEDEVAVLEAIAAASDRVRLETIGETYAGRPLHLAAVADPVPGDRKRIAASPSVLITCTIHGMEPSGREACLILLRQLAFSDAEWVARVLGTVTVLINPTANPDGRALNHEVGAHLSTGRTNSAGQDLNRDHLLLRHPEALALARVLRDHRPDLVIDAHEFPDDSCQDAREG